MTNILVAYASWKGTSQEVAAEIAGILREQGAQVDLEAAGKMRSVEGYDGVVLGASVRMGRPNSAAIAFLRRHVAKLASIPTALFIVCMTMKDCTEENIKTAESYMDKLKTAAPAVKPMAEGLFAGQMVPEVFPWPASKLITREAMGDAGDYRDWEAIRAWAAGLAAKLAG
ncbi:MAG: hypothetical protein HPY76_04855 [Anaerolineae bacterium]|nr:hypothetical protein [Anaerolineae bacterium]